MADQSIHEIDTTITRFQPFLSMLSHSDPLRPALALQLAIKRLRRYMLSKQKEDLDKSIVQFTESILFPPCLWLVRGAGIHDALYLLSLALVQRSTVTKLSEDAVYATKYLRHLRSQPHAALGLTRHAVTKLLVDALDTRVDLEAGNVMQNIGEMATLCLELLALDMSDIDITPSITRFVRTARSKLGMWVPDQPLDQVIECLRSARKVKPDLHDAQVALVECLCSRYCTTFVDDDYEEATSVLDEFPTSTSDILVDRVQRLVTTMAVIRSKMNQRPEYSEETIYRARALLSSFPEERHPTSFINLSLGELAEHRVGYFGSIGGLSASASNFPSVPVVPPKKDGYTRPIREKLELLHELHSRICDDDIMKINETIEQSRSILASSDPKHFLASFVFDSFAQILFEAFERTKKIDYLDESIITRRQAVERPVIPSERFPILSQLAKSLIIRSKEDRDLYEGLELLSQCANDVHASLPDRFLVACVWASTARRSQHTSVSTAYESAVSLMQNILLFAPTLQLQHATLTSSDGFHWMPLDYASYQIDLGQLEDAIETLERGRALLWSEMRDLRTSVDQLQQAEPQLAHNFAVVNRELEELTKSVPPSHKLSLDDDATDGDLGAVDPFGRLLLRQRRLLKERDNLISRIQALPGFNDFLKSPSFDVLRSAASSGPVIIINHSIWRSDILILHDTTPSLIPTLPDFYDRANTLKDELLASRLKYGLDSNHYDQTLASVLAELYKLIGEPVIDRLRQLQVPERSRVWWCPTSVFCSLPLHAMGPIPSDDDETHYFLDLYICSYTPSLTALIQSHSRNHSSQPSNRPSLLLVAQPDPSLPTVGGEIQVVQALDTKVTSLISEAATPTTVIDSFHHHRFVHFACHGQLEAGKPFEARFRLHRDEQLTLLEIVRSHLPTAEFAFLSACHTAEVTEGSIVDEGLHLAAAVQYSGFRSVVGTMWAMVDEDGHDLADYFYKALFATSRREEGIPYHERSAKALRFAVKKLRRKRYITLERWVNFVHYGA